MEDDTQNNTTTVGSEETIIIDNRQQPKPCVGDDSTTPAMEVETTNIQTDLEQIDLGVISTTSNKKRSSNINNDDGDTGATGTKVDTTNDDDDMLEDAILEARTNPKNNAMTTQNDISNSAMIPYLKFNRIDHYPKYNETDVITILCSTKFWYWFVLQRGFGFDAEPSFDEIDVYSTLYGPKLFWKSAPFTGADVDQLLKNENVNPCDTLNRYVPKQLWNELFYGNKDEKQHDMLMMDDDTPEEVVYNRSVILQHRNSMPMPSLRIYILSSNDVCTNLIKKKKEQQEVAAESQHADPIHYKHLNRLLIDNDRAVSYLFEQVPASIYRINPNDMAAAHIQTQIVEKRVDDVDVTTTTTATTNGNKDAKTTDVSSLELYQNVTIEQWAHVKAADAIYNGRPALIINGSEDGLVITATKTIRIMEDTEVKDTSDEEKKSSTVNEPRTTLTVIGQNRTASICMRFHTLNEYCSDKISPDAEDDTININGAIQEIEQNLKIAAKSVTTAHHNKNNNNNQVAKKFPLYTKGPHFESHSMILSEVALLLQSITRNWAGSQILSSSSSNDAATCVVDDNHTQDASNTKPIVIVTGTERDIIQSLLDPDICRKVLHLPILGENNNTDEADFLRQVEIVNRKHLTLHGITSFLMDMGNQASFENSNYVTGNATTATTATAIENNTRIGTFQGPYDLLGLRVAKFFTIGTDKSLYRGTIQSCEKHDVDESMDDEESDLGNDNKILDKYWYCVLYDDGDTEEYDIDKLYDLLKLYVDNFEDDPDEAYGKRMKVKLQQSKCAAEALKPYSFGGNDDNKKKTGAFDTNKMTKTTRKRYLDIDAVREDAELLVADSNLPPAELVGAADSEPKCDLANDGAGVVMEPESSSSVGAEKPLETVDARGSMDIVQEEPQLNLECQQKESDLTDEKTDKNDGGSNSQTETGEIMNFVPEDSQSQSLSQASTVRRRGRPRKYPRVESQQPDAKSQVVVTDPIDVMEYLGRRVCKLFGGIAYFGTVKKYIQGKEVDSTGIIVATTQWRVEYDDGDTDDVESDAVQRMVQLYDKKRTLEE